MTAGFGPECWGTARRQHTGTSTVCKLCHCLSLVFFHLSQRETSKMATKLSKHLNLDHLERFEHKPGSWKFWKRSHVYKGSILQIMAWSQLQASRKLAGLGYTPQHSYHSVNMLGTKKLLEVNVYINNSSNILQSSSSDICIPILQI